MKLRSKEEIDAEAKQRIAQDEEIYKEVEKIFGTEKALFISDMASVMLLGYMHHEYQEPLSRMFVTFAAVADIPVEQLKHWTDKFQANRMLVLNKVDPSILN